MLFFQKFEYKQILPSNRDKNFFFQQVTGKYVFFLKIEFFIYQVMKCRETIEFPLLLVSVVMGVKLILLIRPLFFYQ